MDEEDSDVLLGVLRVLCRQREGREELVGLLSSTDPAVKCEAIQMFRRAGRLDCLVGLLFEDDDRLVGAVKRYMEEDPNDG